METDLLCGYLELIFAVKAETSNTEPKEVKIRANSGADVRDAQNLALRFIGPESYVILSMPIQILNLYTLQTVRRYLAKRCQVIVTVRGERALILRGPSAITELMTRSIHRQNDFPSFPEPVKLQALQQTCQRLDIDFSQLVNVQPELKSGFMDFLVEIENARLLQHSSSFPIFAPQVDNSNNDEPQKPSFIEAFRKRQGKTVFNMNKK